jgi:hypothetical protein
MILFTRRLLILYSNKLLSSDKNVQVSDTTGGAKRTTVGSTKNNFITCKK